MSSTSPFHIENDAGTGAVVWTTHNGCGPLGSCTVIFTMSGSS